MFFLIFPRIPSKSSKIRFNCQRAVEIIPIISKRYISFEPSWKFMSASGSQRTFKLSVSDYQGAFLINCFFCTYMLNPAPPVRTEIIEAQAVLFIIDFFNKSVLQDSPLTRVHNAFENRILNPLTIVLTGLRHTIQTTGSF